MLDTKRYEEGFSKINDFREKAIQIVNDYFTELEERYQ